MKEFKTSEKVRRDSRERMRRKRRAAGVPMKKTFDARFWGRAEPVTESGCLIWLGYVGPSGYGYIGVNGKLQRTHRVAWELSKGPIPEGAHVLHRCDVPCCINPAHLFLGDHAANMADMNRKGRAAVGEVHGNAKLTADAVREILTDVRGPSEVARDYGISPSTVCDLRARRSWTHVTTEQQVAQMLELMPTEVA